MNPNHAHIDDFYDVAIVGGGLAGLTLSALLGKASVKTVCIDRAPDNNFQKDLRTTAISYGSHKILERAGIWTHVPERCPIKDIQILDGDSPVLLNFLSRDVDDKSFGWIVDNALLRTAMLRALDTYDCVTHLTGTTVENFNVCDDYALVHIDQNNNPAAIKTRLVVGADGRQSFTRQWMGVRTRTWGYNQSAIICTVQHEHPHKNIAVEHFWPDGPFAILPMNDDGEDRHRSSIVLTAHGTRADELMNYNDHDFEIILSGYFPERYGRITMQTKRACYPLNLIHAARYTGPRMVLVADAAHGIHPIAGQGLNLGFRDVDQLARLIEQSMHKNNDPGHPDIRETYERTRRPDNMAMVAVTDSLNRLFSNDKKPARMLRRLGLKLVSKLPPAKQFFMRQAMGDHS